MARCSIMLEKALFIIKLFLDEKLLSEDVLVPFFIHGCVLRQNCEWAHSLGWEATPHMNGLRMLYCWHDTGLIVCTHLFFSGQAFFWMPQIIGKGIHQRKWLYPSPQQSNPCTFLLLQNMQSVPDVCPGEKWLLCCPSWHQAILQKSSPHCACRCTHTCLLPFLSKLCTGGAPIPQLNQL